jgi:hypothetical protein
MQLAQVVPARVTRLELDEQFECGLIRFLVETARHLLPMLFEDLRTAAPRFVAVQSIRSGPNDDAARECISTPQGNALQERLVLPRGESARELDAQFVEELRRVDVGEAFKSPANDGPCHTKRLDPGFARLRVDGLQPFRSLKCGDVEWRHWKCGSAVVIRSGAGILSRPRKYRGLATAENVGRISPMCHALDRLATNAARFGGSELTGGVASPSASAAKYACTARIYSRSFKGSRFAEISRNLLLAATAMLSACRRRSQGVCGG